mmetsp:Transcript_6930/g.21639  ORF Transcript_6930/g.21639 Transcript_6930/m.21639 type:complete len:177 (-) Transcript_6930:53-583(-)
MVAVRINGLMNSCSTILGEQCQSMALAIKSSQICCQRRSRERYRYKTNKGLQSNITTSKPITCCRHSLETNQARYASMPPPPCVVIIYIDSPKSSTHSRKNHPMFISRTPIAVAVLGRLALRTYRVGGGSVRLCGRCSDVVSRYIITPQSRGSLLTVMKVNFVARDDWEAVDVSAR